MSKSCGDDKATYGHHLDHCKFAGTQEKCSLAGITNKRSSRKIQNMLAFQVQPDNFTDEETTDQHLSNSGLQAANGNSKKKSFSFLTKFQSRITGALASQASPCINSFHKPLFSREILVREYVKLVCIIRRTAAACFSPSPGADENYDYLPHMQLDKVTHALSKEAFGPLYLVT